MIRKLNSTKCSTIHLSYHKTFRALSVCRCYNKLPQTDWLKATHSYSLGLLEASAMTPNQGAGKVTLSLDALGKNLFLACLVFWWLLTSLDVWPCHSLPLWSQRPLSCLCKSPSAPSYEDIHSTNPG